MVPAVGLPWRWLKVALREATEFRDSHPNEAGSLLWSLDYQKEHVQRTGRSPEARKNGRLQAIPAYRGGELALWLYFQPGTNCWIALHLAIIEVPKSPRGRVPDPTPQGWALAKTRSLNMLPRDVTSTEPTSN